METSNDCTIIVDVTDDIQITKDDLDCLKKGELLFTLHAIMELLFTKGLIIEGQYNIKIGW